MILLNRRVDYALLILCYLHHRKDGGCAREIADHYRLSRAFVANILKDLCQRKFVVSQRGVRGGYVAAADTAASTLAALIDSLENTLSLAACNHLVDGAKCCNLADGCPIRGPIDAVHSRIRSVLETTTLAEVFAEGAGATMLLDTSRCTGAVCAEGASP